MNAITTTHAETARSAPTWVGPILITSWSGAYHVAVLAGRDAGNAHMRKAGRDTWTAEDYDVSAETVQRIMRSMGYGPCDGAPVSAWEGLV